MKTEEQQEIEQRIKSKITTTLKGIDVDLGWFPLIDQLDKDLTAIDPNYEIHQVKEKFGGLRYYAQASSGLTDKLYQKFRATITEAENRSFKTCEVSGNPGVLMQQGYTLRTLDPEVYGPLGWEVCKQEW